MKRLQYRRVKGWKFPENAIYVGRGRGDRGRFGNQYEVSVYGRRKAVELYKIWLKEQELRDLKGLVEFLRPLRGKDLVCWCLPLELCHGDALLETVSRIDALGLFDSLATKI